MEAIYLDYKASDSAFAAEKVEEIRQMVRASGRDIKVIEMGAGE